MSHVRIISVLLPARFVSTLVVRLSKTVVNLLSVLDGAAYTLRRLCMRR